MIKNNSPLDQMAAFVQNAAKSFPLHTFCGVEVRVNDSEFQQFEMIEAMGVAPSLVENNDDQGVQLAAMANRVAVAKRIFTMDGAPLAADAASLRQVIHLFKSNEVEFSKMRQASRVAEYFENQAKGASGPTLTPSEVATGN